MGGTDMHRACTERAPHVHTFGRLRATRAAGFAGIKVALTVCSFAAAVPTLAQGAGEIALPSGRSVTFNDVIWGEPGPAGLTVRFRFIEPGVEEAIADMDYVDIEADMAYLCETYALARISDTGPQPSQVMISISDRPVEFGEADPDATQIFEAYRRDGDACIWEGF
jgi:hypothetical protein